MGASRDASPQLLRASRTGDFDPKAYPMNTLKDAKKSLAKAAGKPEAPKLRQAILKKFPGLKQVKDCEESKIKENGSLEIRETQTARIIEASNDGVGGEKIFKVALITEGLGNRRNMNYYGPEAITSAVTAFEARFCYLDHQSLFGEKNLPERSVRDKAGYFKNLKETVLDGKKACVGELHCDLSEAGKYLADKMASALHYKTEFPEGNYEYVGLSVNGDGDAENRKMTIDGDEVTVNYVNAFTEGDSCDLVTTPARGGRGLAVIKEDAYGFVHLNAKEERDMLKQLKVIFANLKESASKATGDAKKKLEESKKQIEGLIKNIETHEAEGGEAETMCAKREDESDSDHHARMSKLYAASSKALGKQSEGEEGEEESEEESAADKPAGSTAKGGSADNDGDADDSQEEEEEAEESEEEEAKVKQESKRSLSTSDLKRNRLAIKSVIAESGIDDKVYSAEDIDQLARMPFKLAESKIKRDARFLAAAIESRQFPVASLRGSLRESTDKSALGVFKSAFDKGAR